jgi:hypothetical protein
VEKPPAANLQSMDAPPIAFSDLDHVDALTAIFDASQFGGDSLPPALVISEHSEPPAPLGAVDTTIGGTQLAASADSNSIKSDAAAAATISPTAASGAGDAADKPHDVVADGAFEPLEKFNGGAVELAGEQPKVHQGFSLSADSNGAQPAPAIVPNGASELDAPAAALAHPLQEGDPTRAGSEAGLALSPSGILEHAPALAEVPTDFAAVEKVGDAAAQVDSIAAPYVGNEPAAEPNQDAAPSPDPQSPQTGASPPPGYVSSGAWFSDAAVKLVGLEHHFDPAVLLH